MITKGIGGKRMPKRMVCIGAEEPALLYDRWRYGISDKDVRGVW